MANVTRQEVKTEYKRLRNAVFTKAILKRAGEEAGKEAIKIIQERTLAGIDQDGQPFRDYSKRYPRRKQKYIDGVKAKASRARDAKRRGKEGKDIPKNSKWAARKVRDVGRLSGWYFAGMSYKNARGSTTSSGSFTDLAVEFDLALSDRAGPGKHPAPSKLDGWLRSMGYEIFGIALVGPTARKEHARIKRRIAETLALHTSQSGSISLTMKD